jgi:hypothetical protein
MTDLRGQLQAIYLDHGKLTPDIVVDEARPVDSPLHPRFEWDDTVAGEAWRREQAHRLIQSVRVTFCPETESEGPHDVRAFHAVRTEKGHVYEPVDRVTHDPFLARLVLADMERDWRALRRRYETFQEFWDLVRGDFDEGAKAA